MISERLRMLRKERDLSKRDLVNQLPINYSTYANYESGFREPNSEVLQILSRYFGVSLDYLLGVSDNRKKAEDIAILTDDENTFIKNYRQLDTHGREVVDIVMQKEVERVSFLSTRSESINKPLIDDKWVVLKVYDQKASAGLGNYFDDNCDRQYEEMRFVATQVSEKADFCVRIMGDSMEPKICDGDIVFVKAVPKVDPDNVGIFLYDGESYCKRLRVDHRKGVVILESLNKAFAPKEIAQPDNLRTVGMVIGIAE
ncbi:MAG: XRE family transcriptional regulator [Clostridiales bacterium]|jgi:phage repressor protein C with HTH and peptisase S24 domain/DNA-binding XRE family transcriptional regulator|nr:XRE family transcriptional regulator [Clostridiales bacterium]